MTKTETRNDKLKAAHDKLQQAVAEIASGDDWQRMLQVASKFHKYSSGGIAYLRVVNGRERHELAQISDRPESENAVPPSARLHRICLHQL